MPPQMFARRRAPTCGWTRGSSTSSTRPPGPTPPTKRGSRRSPPTRTDRRRPQAADDLVAPLVGEDEAVALGRYTHVGLGLGAVAEEVRFPQHLHDRRVLVGEPAARDL